MFNPTEIVIDAFVKRLRENYLRSYGILEPEYPNIIEFFGRLALENIANSDAAYHDLDHTICVADVGQVILKGKHLRGGGVSPKNWLHFTIACLCHDIGYIRGVVTGDQPNAYIINKSGETVSLADGATDASLSPWHVDRSMLFVNHWLRDITIIDADQVCAMIDYTRFPVPESSDYKETGSYRGLLRSADLIGQMGDINYLKKSAALYSEFLESGVAKRLNYSSAADLRSKYPLFFWKVIRPLVHEALNFLQVTQEGKQWLASLYAHVFVEEHLESGLGAERRKLS